MIEMMLKWISALTPVAAIAVLAGVPVLRAERAALQQVRNVYLMPMGYGLDQYLANRLTAEGVFQVVTDPKRADAVLTDQLGLGFERRFEDLFPAETKPAEPVAAATAGAEAGKADAKPKPKQSDADAFADVKRGGPPVSSFSRGKGNVFLVDVKSRGVLWSLYERPKKILPDDLDRTSGRIVERLKKDLSGKP